MAYKRISELAGENQISGDELLVMQDPNEVPGTEARQATVKQVFNAQQSLVIVASLNNIPAEFYYEDGKQVYCKDEGMTYKCVLKSGHIDDHITASNYEFVIKADAGNYFIAETLEERDTSTSIVRNNGVECYVEEVGIKYKWDSSKNAWVNAEKYITIQGDPDDDNSDWNTKIDKENISDGTLIYSEETGIIYRCINNETGIKLEATTIGGNVTPLLSYIIEGEEVAAIDRQNGLTSVINAGDNVAFTFNVKVFIGGNITMKVFRGNSLYQTINAVNGLNTVDVGKVNNETTYRITVVDAFNNETEYPLLYTVKVSELYIDADFDVKTSDVLHGLKGMTTRSPFDFQYSVMNTLTDSVTVIPNITGTCDDGTNINITSDPITITKSQYGEKAQVKLNAYNTILTDLISKLRTQNLVSEIEEGQYAFNKTGTYSIQLSYSISAEINEETVTVNKEDEPYTFIVAEAGKIYLNKVKSDDQYGYNSVSNVALDFMLTCEGLENSVNKYETKCNLFNAYYRITKVNNENVSTEDFPQVTLSGISTAQSDKVSIIYQASSLQKIYSDGTTDRFNDEGLLTIDYEITVRRATGSRLDFDGYEDHYETTITGQLTIKKFVTGNRVIQGYTLSGEIYSQTEGDGNLIFDIDMNSALKGTAHRDDSQYNYIPYDAEKNELISSTDNRYKIKVFNNNDFCGLKEEEYTYTDRTTVDDEGNYKTIKSNINYYRFTKNAYGVLVDENDHPVNLID